MDVTIDFVGFEVHHEECLHLNVRITKSDREGYEMTRDAQLVIWKGDPGSTDSIKITKELLEAEGWDDDD